jgi:hypothetical protein
MKPKLKMKGAKDKGGVSAMHEAVERPRKSELQMPKQIEKRGRDGYR